MIDKPEAPLPLDGQQRSAALLPEAAAKRSGWLWPWMIVGLLGLHLVATLVMVFVATHDRSFAVEPNYYQKALHWDDSAQQQRENQRLGWHAALEVGREKSTFGDRAVTCRLTDAAGQPLRQAFIDVVAFAHARGANRFSLAVVEDPGARGIYRGSLPFRYTGLWEFRLVIHHGRDVFTSNQQQQVE